jgi:hypothetical protein
LSIGIEPAARFPTSEFELDEGPRIGKAVLRPRRPARAARVLGRPDPVSVIRPDNVASIRVAQKLGARLERRMILRGEEVVIYRHRYTDR